MKIVSNEMKHVLPKTHLNILNVSTKLANEMDTDLYLVGGCVRDIMMGLNDSNFDIDLTGTNVDKVFATRLAEKLGGTVKNSSMFGTHKLNIPVGLNDNLEIDIAKCRSETYKNPGQLPDVSPGDLLQDLGRRDFSIAAMCIVLRPPSNQGWVSGQLIDPHFGYADLINKKLRVLHLRSFVDDPTRMFRIVRYSCRLGFDIEDSTSNIFQSSLSCVTTVSGDRIRGELEKIFNEKEVNLILYQCVKLGLLPAFLTEYDCNHLMGLKTTSYANSQDNCAEFWFGILAMNADKDQAEYLSQTLNLSSKQTNVILDLVHLNEQIQQNKAFLIADDLRRSDIFKFLSKYSLTSIRICATTTRNKDIKSVLEIYLNSLINISLELNGDDLISIGVNKGPELGNLLNELLYAKIDGHLNSADQETQFVKDYISVHKNGN
ncbi:MAG: hypothetical protein CL904_04125 [Dehalococcoidia bacterium]|nr:hypothetical protein [Dehalococcoidia bacterium]MQG15888.1 CCA tRNA nucleotidyltransferase [SAR202 cluster bacterium]|tara:strand:+ start:30857 stop:32155 length:1299 start_codon:yes stop_codon:yes gene_type:complete